MNPKIIVGITGGIGSGKSITSSILMKMGYPVFSSDEAAKKIVIESNEVKEEIEKLLGKNAYLEDGSYNTAFISNIVFQEKETLNCLNNIIHPRVRSAFKKFVEESESEIIFNEAAILFETGVYKDFHKIILITAPIEIRIKRCMMRDQVSREAIIAKINRQWSDEKKLTFNPFQIINNGKEPLVNQIEEVLSQLKKRKLNHRGDIELLINLFYSKVLKNKELSPFFNHLNFEKHLPKMMDFWSFVLLGTSGYTTNVIEKHLHMPLKTEHFDLWLHLFNETLDQLFEGEQVEIAKQRAFQIAWTTKSKMNLI